VTELERNGMLRIAAKTIAGIPGRRHRDGRVRRELVGSVKCYKSTMATRIRCSVDSGWYPVATKAEASEFEDQHAECGGVIESEGSIDSLPTT